MDIKTQHEELFLAPLIGQVHFDPAHAARIELCAEARTHVSPLGGAGHFRDSLGDTGFSLGQRAGRAATGY